MYKRKKEKKNKNRRTIAKFRKLSVAKCLKAIQFPPKIKITEMELLKVDNKKNDFARVTWLKLTAFFLV